MFGRNRFSKLFLIVLIFAISVGCGDDKKEDFPQATFEMEMKNSKGEQVSMEEFEGKVIFFNVWATWCAPCIKEMPMIHNLYKEVEDRDDVAFLMLSMDQDFEKAIEFRNTNGYEFEIYRLTGPMPAMYHTTLIPTTFIINSEGKLVLQHDGMGEFDSEEFKEYFSEIN
jgi:thiol-disulfide isomerase/thioredoxin